MMNIKKTLLFVLTLFVIGCQSETIDPITEYQKSLIMRLQDLMFSN